MLKVLLPLAFAGVAAGAVVWALMPATAPTQRASTADTAAEAAGGVAGAKGPKGRAQNAAKRPPMAAVHNRSRRNAAGQVAGKTGVGAAVAAGSGRVGDALERPTKAGSKDPVEANPGTPTMPSIDTASLKGSVRTYYAGLPKSGRMPSRILAEEVLPMAVLDTANVPPGSVLTMLGSWHTDRIDGFEEALALPDTGDGIIGFTVTHPDGTTQRTYIQTHE